MPLRVQKTPDPPGTVPRGDGQGRAVGVAAEPVGTAYYSTSGRRGRQPMPLPAMLRSHCMQQWFSFSDRQIGGCALRNRERAPFCGLCRCH